MKNMTMIERFNQKIKPDPVTGCILWTGAISSSGYPAFGKTTAHRWLYLHHHGFIPEKFVIDHLCDNPKCVNIVHLKAVTVKVNTLRGRSPTAVNAVKTHCIHGHELSGDNLYIKPNGKRQCRECHMLEGRRRRKEGKT